ncbi:MAG: hypothetical protein ACRC5T_04025 [Cetobacterium sp.]
MKLTQVLKNLEEMKYGTTYTTIEEVTRRTKQLKAFWNCETIYILSIYVSNAISEFYIFDNFDDIQDYVSYELENNEDTLYDIKEL